MAVQVMIPKEGTMENCLIVKWNYKVGDKVNIGDLICEVETDKSVFDLESPGTGTILEIFNGDGSEVPLLTTIAIVGEPGEDYSGLIPKGKYHEAAGGKVLSSPRARRLSGEKNVPLSMLNGSGPKGSIVEKDVLKWLSENQPLIPAALDDYTEIPVKGIRKIAAERMLSSVLTTAQYTLITSADAEKLLECRSRFKNSSTGMGIREITINDMLLYAVSRALVEFKELNCHFVNDKILQFNSVNLAFAVDTPKGLIVPVIKKAETMSLKEISAEAERLSGLCRNGKIASEDISGGTFTVSNLGSLGIDTFTPILNPPQVAILGIGRINLKPVSCDGQVCFKNHIELSLTINHQIVDGAPGARFLRLLSEYILNIDLQLNGKLEQY